jgi:WD40 repeat protein
MTSGISSPLLATERDRQHRDDAGVRRGRALPAGLAALAGLLLAALAARGVEPRDSLDLGEDPCVLAVALSPDGSLLAVYNNKPLKDKDKVLTLWDVATKKQVAVLKATGWQASWDLCFTADGKDLIVGGNSVIVWDLATFKERRRIDDFEIVPDAYGHVLFTPDGKWMLAGSTKRGVLVFDMATGKVAKSIQCDEAPIGQITVMALSPDGKTLAVGTGNGSASKWVGGGGMLFLCDLEKGEVRHKIANAGEEFPGRACYDIRGLAFSPDGKLLASSASETLVQIWDPVTGKNLDFLQVGFSVRRPHALAFSPDGKTLAMGGATVELWDVGMFGFRDDFWGRPKQGGGVEFLAFTPDGKTLVTAGHNNVPIEFWDVPAGAPKDVRRDKNPPPSLPRIRP